MTTVIMDKKKFIDWLQKQVGETDIIVMSQSMVGTASVNKKKNEKRVTFSFAADSFMAKDDIGHIAFGLTPTFSVVVCERKYASLESIEMIDVKKFKK